MSALTKLQVAERLAEIKALIETLSAEEKTLRQHLAVGDKLVGAFGEVSMTERNQVSYDNDLYQDLLVLGVDPMSVGKVKITPNDKMVATVVATNPQVKVALDKNKSEKKISVVRIKPDASVTTVARTKVASMIDS
jgi:hypothetical protein